MTVLKLSSNHVINHKIIENKSEIISPTLITPFSHSLYIFPRHEIDNLLLNPTFLAVIVSLDTNYLSAIGTSCIFFHPANYALNMKEMITGNLKLALSMNADTALFFRIIFRAFIPYLLRLAFVIMFIYHFFSLGYRMIYRLLYLSLIID